jgi:hypothetical protein
MLTYAQRAALQYFQYYRRTTEVQAGRTLEITASTLYDKWRQYKEEYFFVWREE